MYFVKNTKKNYKNQDFGQTIISFCKVILGKSKSLIA
jgi:hypothetical protein